MDKNSFLSAFTRNSVDYKLPNGDSVILNELTAGQRGKLYEIIRETPDKIQVAVVAMSVDFLSDDDLQAVESLPANYVEEMASKVMSISGFDEDAEKN